VSERERSRRGRRRTKGERSMKRIEEKRTGGENREDRAKQEKDKRVREGKQR
jgi:hypothetical protein